MIILAGCNHRSAPLALRERLAFPEAELAGSLERLLEQEGIAEALILSTCNRVEVLARVDADPLRGVQTVKNFLCTERGLSPEELERHSYHFQGRDVVQHLFRVAAGLDSMILGEPQILGQVKQAYLTAKDAGATGSVLERLCQQCLATAKRVRTETGIGRNAVSVAYAAANLARQIFGGLENRRALLIGAGEMGELVARHLRSSREAELFVVSRTYNHAVVAAESCGGKALHWDKGLSQLHEMDIVVSCTASAQPVLNRSDVAGALRLRRGEPLFMIDIAVPRDIDPEVNGLDNAYVYDIDALQGVVDVNLDQRKQAARDAQQRIVNDVRQFLRWQEARNVKPMIVKLRESVYGIARGELDRYRERMGPLSAEQEQVLEEMARAMLQKVLHRPVQRLKQSVERGDTASCSELYAEIFDLPPTRPSGASEPASPVPQIGPRRILRGGKDG